jgi:hypothetical protein
VPGRSGEGGVRPALPPEGCAQVHDTAIFYYFHLFLGFVCQVFLCQNWPVNLCSDGIVDCVVNEFLAVVELFVIVAAPTRAIANLPS